MSTAVVILNWNTREYLSRFLPSLIQSCEGLDARVVVADSCSEDGSVEFVRKDFPQVEVIPLDDNYGFSGGYNRALAQITDTDYFVLINSDVLVERDWLKELLSFMESHPDCGACGPKLLSYADRTSFEYAGAAGGLIDRHGFPFCRGRVMGHVEKDHGQYDSPAQVLWASGACLMVRSSVWRDQGGLDSRFFAHQEEIDLCWRMQLEGWKVYCVPSSAVYHIGGGTLSSDSPFKLKLNFRNNLLMLENCLPFTLALEGHGPRKAVRKAGARIFRRMVLDGAIAVMYLLSGRLSYTRAVLDAHREFKELRHGMSAAEVARYASTHGEGIQVSGLSRYSVLFSRKSKLTSNQQ